MDLTTAFSVDDLDRAIKAFRELGFVVLQNAVSSADLDKIEEELTEAQRNLINGQLDDRYGTELLDEPGATL